MVLPLSNAEVVPTGKPYNWQSQPQEEKHQSDLDQTKSLNLQLPLQQIYRIYVTFGRLYHIVDIQ